MSNNLYEFGSSVDVILRVKSDCTIGGKEYKKRQIYTIFKDVGIGFTYMVTSTNIAAKKPIYAGDIENLPEQIAINNVPISSKVANLIFSYTNETSFEKTIVENIEVIGGSVYLKYEPSRDLFLLKNDGSVLAADEYTIEGDVLMTPDGRYKVMYCTVADGTVYGFGADYFPYFEVEIVGKGNINKQTKNVYMFFPAVKITQVPSLDLNDEGVCYSPFVFNVIYERQERPRIVFED